MTIVTPSSDLFLDDGTELFDPPGAGVQSRYGKVGGAVRVIDLGPSATPYFGVMAFGAAVGGIAVLNRTGSTAESYQAVLEGCAEPTFSSGVQTLVTWNLGVQGQQEFCMFSNYYTGNNLLYRYIRLREDVSGVDPKLRALVFIKPLVSVDPLTIEELITKQSLLYDNIFNSVKLYREYQAGTVDGGPNGDGYYPLYDGLGGTYLAPCPRKMEEMAGADAGGLSQPEVDALAEFLDSSIEPTIPVTVPDGAGRSLKKIGLYHFTRRMGPDLAAQSDLLNVEYIPGFLSTGQERRIAINAIRQQFGEIIDPTRSPYNVVYDYRKGQGAASMANGSNVVELNANISFETNDVGKLIFVGNSNATVGVTGGYIGAILDPKHATIVTTKGGSTPVNATMVASNQDVIWGTDCTAGIQAAFNDAEPKSIYDKGRIVYITGVCMVTHLEWGSISVVGVAPTNCGFAHIPIQNDQRPMYQDKQTGVYATIKPSYYTHMNLGFFGNQYVQYWNSFRTLFQIYGGLSTNYRDSAPYSYIQNLDCWLAQWNGFHMYGAFAGKADGLRAMFCAQNGIRSGLWDVNGHSWHAEGNGYAGIVDYMAGANLTTLKCSYNGVGGAGAFIYENGCNYLCLGTGGTITNLRVQESWGPNIVFSSYDPLNAYNNASRRNKFNQITIDDTGNIGAGKGVRPASLPPVRSMILFRGASVQENLIQLTTGEFGVNPAQYATHGYFDMEGPSKNKVVLDTLAGITNDPADWYNGNGSTIPGGTGAYVPGPWGTTSFTSIGARNVVIINDERVQIELQRLRLSATGFLENSPEDTIIGDILGMSPGEVPTILSPDGRFKITGSDEDGWKFRTGAVPTVAADDISQILLGALSGAPNSPRETPIKLFSLAAMPGIALDTFSDEAGVILDLHSGQYGSTWVKHPLESQSGQPLISPSSTLYFPYSGQFPVYITNITPSSADYWVETQFDVKTVVTGDAVGVIGRALSNALTFYMARYNNGTIQLIRVNNGTFTTLGTQSVTAWSAGQTPTLRLTMNGSTISAQWNGATVVSVTDGSPLAGAGRYGARCLVATAQTPTTGSHLTKLTAGLI